MTGGFVRLDVTVREATHDDAELFSHIHRGAFTVGWSRSTFEIFLQDKINFGLLASVPRQETGTMPVGFALLRQIGSEAELLSIAVMEEHRGNGVGTALVYRLRDLLMTRGATELFLEVGRRNAAALALYQKHGFTTVGARSAYYSSRENLPGDDALILKLGLS